MANGQESQGKTIALVVFVVLTIMSSVLAYYFWEQTDRLSQQAKNAEDGRRSARTSEELTRKNYADLKEKVLGTRDEEDHTQIMRIVGEELAAPKVSEPRKPAEPYATYRAALDHLQTQLVEADNRVDQLSKQKTELEDQLKQSREQYQTEVDKHAASQKEAEQQLAAETQRLLGVNSNLEKQNEDLADRYGRLRDERDQIEREMTRNVNALQERNNKLTYIVREVQRERGRRYITQFESTDGQVTHLSDGGRTAYINIGSDDGLRTGVTFGIYGKDVGGNPFELPKANLEITRLLGPHRALGRVSAISGDPVVTGDDIFNPIWSPGQTQGVAFVGLMHVDDDSSADNDLFRRIVLDNGGHIDAYADIDAMKINGDIKVTTGWLVVGDIPEIADFQGTKEEKEVVDFLNQANGKLREEAEQHGVSVISLRNFLTYMGHNVPKRSVAAGDEYRVKWGPRRPRLVDTEPQPAVLQDSQSGTP